MKTGGLQVRSSGGNPVRLLDRGWKRPAHRWKAYDKHPLHSKFPHAKFTAGARSQTRVRGGRLTAPDRTRLRYRWPSTPGATVRYRNDR